MNAPLPHPVTRMSLQQELERLITEFHPDAIEALEIICAIEIAIHTRYEHHAEEVMKAFRRLRDELDELDERHGSVGPFYTPPCKDDQFA